MKNPLYPTKPIPNDLLKNYNRCLVITLDKYSVFDIFNKEITSDTYYDDIINNYNIKSIPMWIIKLINQQINFIIFEISEDDLLKFNFNLTNMNEEKISYNLTEAVLLIPNHTWSWIYNYIEPYVKDGLNDMYKYLINTDFINTPIMETLSSQMYIKIYNDINSSLDVTYWKNISKCRINITSSWLSRDINFSDAKEINSIKQQEMNDKCNDYLQDMINKHKYVDASSGLKTHKYSLYYINEYSNTPVEKMIEKLINYNLLIMNNTSMLYIYNKINQEIILLINNCLISKKYCHRILKNKLILKYIQGNIFTFFNNFSYAWLMMYIEEGILKTMIKETDRCVFTLKDAYYLPNCVEHNNIYLPMMVEKKYIKMIGGYLSSRKPSIIFSSMDEFKIRLNTFSNNNTIDIFKNLDWTNIAITGSVIPATCRIDALEIDGGYTSNTFFDTYYGDSDIDVMIDIQNQLLYIDRVHYFANVIKTNIMEKFPDTVDCIQIDMYKTCVLHINQKFYKDKITLESAYDIYCKLKKDEIKQTDKNYEIINKVCSIDQFKYFIYNNDTETNTVNYTENIKYHISSPHLKRRFEIFKIKYNFLSTVSRFHLPCVRGYYNGTDVYLLPSAISSLLTNICMDYKYFAGVRSPFEIILKYNFRGFSIMLNNKELIKIVEYINNTEKWSKIYNIDDTFKLNTNTLNAYYASPFVFLNKPNIKYIQYRIPIHYQTYISPIISSIGYIIPIKN